MDEGELLKESSRLDRISERYGDIENVPEPLKTEIEYIKYLLKKTEVNYGNNTNKS